MIRCKTNKFESRRLTLEERINRLERALVSNRRLRKFESISDDMATELNRLLDENECWPDDVKVMRNGTVEITLNWDYFGIAKFYVSVVGNDFVVKSNRDDEETFSSLEECAQYIASEDHIAAADL